VRKERGGLGEKGEVRGKENGEVAQRVTFRAIQPRLIFSKKGGRLRRGREKEKRKGSERGGSFGGV